MNNLEQAARLALSALEDVNDSHNITYAGVITALRAALAQQAEPVAEPHKQGIAADDGQFMTQAASGNPSY